MTTELVDAARIDEMETFKKRGVCEKGPIEECWKSIGKAPVGVMWVDTNKGRQGESRLPAQVGGQGDQEGQAGGFVRSSTRFKGQKGAYLALGEYARDVLIFWRRSVCVLSCEGKGKSVCGFVDGLRGR